MIGKTRVYVYIYIYIYVYMYISYDIYIFEQLQTIEMIS